MKRLLLTTVATISTLMSVSGIASATTHRVTTVAANTPPAVSAPAPQLVTVQPGDYLSKIAADHGTTYLRLYYANTDINNPDLIFPGQSLRVPDNNETLKARDLPTTAPDTIKQTVAANPAADTQPIRYTAPTATPSAVAGGTNWDRLAACESGGNWAIDTGNGFYGGLQFTMSSWAAVGGSGSPSQASREEQIARATILQSRQGWGAWPACSAKLGL